MLARSVEIEDESLGVAVCLQLETDFIADGGAIAGMESVSVEVDVAPHHLDPGVPSGFEVVNRHLTGVESSGIERNILVNGQRSIAYTL